MVVASETKLLVDSKSASSSITSFASPSMFSNLQMVTSVSESGSGHNEISNSDAKGSISGSVESAKSTKSASATSSAGSPMSFNPNSKLAYILTSVLFFPLLLSSF